LEPHFELSIDLPPRGSRRLLRELHRQLKAAVIDGRLKPGLRLPATRELAAALGVSRKAAVAAYDLLIGEGYFVARPGSGTFVANNLPRISTDASQSAVAADQRLAEFWRQPAVSPAVPGYSGTRFDLRAGASDPALFPSSIWRQLTARALRAGANAPIASVPPEGNADLRAAIARHVSSARAVACAADDIVVTAGAQQAFDLLARILVTPGRTLVAVENPGYPPLREVFLAAGAKIAAVPVDRHGMRVDLLPPETRVICVTPAHQLPVGVSMSAGRRAALLDFATAQGAVVIEDDGDGEFRFAGRPLDALQAIDRTGCVFHVGTFSRTLSPSLRLGFAVAPAWARRSLVAAKRIADGHAPALVQEILAAFITEGHFTRHVRRMHKVYGARRAALLDALSRHGAGLLQPLPAIAGLHVAVTFASVIARTVDARTLAAKAAESGIALEPIDRYTLGPTDWNGLIFGYGAILEADIDAAIHQIVQLMRASC
jgi:GntR family transcriptional regulator/MocR family aminotransferase